MIKNRRWTFFPIIVMVILFIGIIIPVHAGTTNNPAISVAVSPSTITQDDTLHITGSSSDAPSSGISIWILCKNYAEVVTVQPDSTGMFSYDIVGTTISSQPNTGKCYIVAQHPMQNNQFDIYLKSSSIGGQGYGEVHNRLSDTPVKIDATHVFKILGGGRIAGSDALEYLTEALKDPNVDDSYAETQFSVTAPTTTVPPSTVVTTSPISTTTTPTVTVYVAGDQNYFGGETLQLSGTNTVSDKTYLFLLGPNIPSTGGSIKATDPKNIAKKVVTDDVTNFQTVNVLSDHTWSWTWKTENVDFEAGTYTIYAVSAPKNKNDLSSATSGLATIMMHPASPLHWAKASPTSINNGEKILITGAASGHPSKGLQIWTFGKNYASKKNVAINSDESISYVISQEETKNLDPGVYYVVIQHPMGDGIFNIDQCSANPNETCNIQTSGQTKLFKMFGPGSIVGADAAEALVAGINEPNVDDTAIEIQFTIIGTGTKPYITTSPTIEPSSSFPTSVITSPKATTIPTATVNYSATIERLERENAEQNAKIEEQGNWIDQILRFLGLK